MCGCIGKRCAGKGDSMGNGLEISVIVPVYNGEQYLRECVESVTASAGAENWELLLVDDGSTDGSGALIRTLAEEYPAVCPLSCGKNRGLSGARLLGLEEARGKYVFFLDCDDAVEPDYVAALYRAAEKENCDIVYAGFSRWSDGLQKVYRPVLDAGEPMTGQAFLERRMDLRDDHNYVWCALYRREFLLSVPGVFEPEVRLYEDILFYGRTAPRAARVCAVPEYGYRYRIRSGSLVQDGVQRRDVQAMLDVLGRLRPELAGTDAERYLFLGVSMCLYYIGTLRSSGKLSRREAKEYYQQLSRLQLLPGLRRAARTRRERIKWLLWRIDWRLFYLLVQK